MLPLRVLRGRIDDPHRKPLRADTLLEDYAKCRYPVRVNEETPRVAAASTVGGPPYEIGCLEGNSMDPRTQWVVTPSGPKSRRAGLSNGAKS